MTNTAFICTVVIIVLAIYDLIAVSVGGIDHSVSMWFNHYGLNAPYLVFSLGYLAGHFWGYMKPSNRLFEVQVYTANEFGNFKTNMFVRSLDYPSEKTLRKVLTLGDEVVIMSVKEKEMFVV